MASYTTNLNLKKPAGSENVAIGDINNNMDAIDQAYGTLNSNMLKVDTTTVTLSAKGSTVGAFSNAGYVTISSDRNIVSVLPVLPNTDWIMTVSINANRHTIYCNANGADTITLIYTYI